MAKYILPFVETIRGYYEIEADSITAAIDYIDDTGMIGEEAVIKDGYVDWDIEDLYEAED